MSAINYTLVFASNRVNIYSYVFYWRILTIEKFKNKVNALAQDFFVVFETGFDFSKFLLAPGLI